MFVNQVHTWYPQRPEEIVRSPGTEVANGCELPCGCWKSHTSLPLEEWLVILTTEVSLQPLYPLLPPLPFLFLLLLFSSFPSSPQP